MICFDHQNGGSRDFFPYQSRGMTEVGDPCEASQGIEQVVSSPFEVKAHWIIGIVRNAERMNPEVFESEGLSRLENLPARSVL